MLTPEILVQLVHRRGTVLATEALVDEINRGHGTVNFIAVDAEGNVASGVSTSGLALKYPGRVGDSPIIGAGNYADNRYGAATCTGYGEMAIQAATAHSVVLYMKMGLLLEEAGAEAMHDLRHLDLPLRGMMNLIAVDKEARHWGASTSPGRTYLYMTAEMDEPVVAKRVHIPLAAPKGCSR